MLWDTLTGEPVATVPAVPFNGSSVQLTDDASRIVSRTLDGRIAIHDSHTGALLTSMQGDPGKASVDRSPDGRSLIVDILGGRSELWDVSNGRLLATFVEDTSALYNRTGDRLITAGPWGAPGVALWDAHTGRQLATGGDPGDLWEHRTGQPFTADGTYVVTPSEDGRVAVLDVRTGQVHLNLGRVADPPKMVDKFRVRLAPDGRTLIARYPDGNAVLWDLAKRRRLAQLGAFTKSAEIEPPWYDELGHPEVSAPKEFLFTQDGERLIARDRFGVLTLWNTRTGRPIRELGAVHADSDITGNDYFELSPGDSWVVLSRAKGATELWRARDGKHVVTGRHQRFADLTFSADERFLAIDGDEQPTLWDLDNGVRLADLGEKSSTSDGEFSDDGARFASTVGPQASLTPSCGTSREGARSRTWEATPPCLTHPSARSRLHSKGARFGLAALEFGMRTQGTNSFPVRVQRKSI
ncbi:WD40 repeat domain-containing protein [Caulobacter sp. 17J65-9]|uniref:WD40 repeat domain-containing protein n=1 Tax=Caulobacter sp. 17J65-9 TaxID=2709382 RepID=UPI0013C692CD|nr:WD40 repeat domain-containing protein [Caulobacter sp. 17J65-9]NEX91292.1 WD40 repeat domain-containing protein [Caulobacter sp. 17J65-9]